MEDRLVRFSKKLDLQFADLRCPVDLTSPITLANVIRAAATSTAIPLEAMASLLDFPRLQAFWDAVQTHPFIDDGELSHLLLQREFYEWGYGKRLRERWDCLGVYRNPDPAFGPLCSIMASPVYKLSGLLIKVEFEPLVNVGASGKRPVMHRLKFAPQISVIDFLAAAFEELNWCAPDDQMSRNLEKLMNQNPQDTETLS